jgi:hypothetical protein
MSLLVYCSGSIQKGPRDYKKSYWSDTERDAVALGARPEDIIFLNPDDPTVDIHDYAALFGRDMFQVRTADAVIVDARERRGIGIGIEILASRIFQTLLIAVVPNETYYRMGKVTYRGSAVSDYVHPHLAVLADGIVESFESAGRWLVEHRELKPKGSDAILEAITAYEQRMLKTDEPMQKILHSLKPHA